MSKIVFPQDATASARYRLRTDGWCVVDIDSTDRKALLNFADELGLGARQHHLRGDDDGIAEVTAASTTAKSAIVKEQFLDLGTRQHDPHTDGTMLDGFALLDGRPIRVSPPAYVCMHMVQPVRRGGASLVVDCQPLLEDLVYREPELFRQLVRPCVAFCRDNDLSSIGPVVSRISATGRWSIRWRYDFTTLLLESSAESLLHFQRTYVCNPKYRRRFRLKAGQVLVVDNFRILHGREVYQDDVARPRLVHRLHIADKTVYFVSPTTARQCQHALQRLHHYLPMTSGAPQYHHRETGIQLELNTERTARKLLAEASLPDLEQPHTQAG